MEKKSKEHVSCWQLVSGPQKEMWSKQWRQPLHSAWQMKWCRESGKWLCECWPWSNKGQRNRTRPWHGYVLTANSLLSKPVIPLPWWSHILSLSQNSPRQSFNVDWEGGPDSVVKWALIKIVKIFQPAPYAATKWVSAHEDQMSHGRESDQRFHFTAYIMTLTSFLCESLYYTQLSTHIQLYCPY